MWFPRLLPAHFIKRSNRFTAAVRLVDGTASIAFVPTTGRLTGALTPGCRVWLEPAQNPQRKTPHSLVLSELPRGGFCSLNAYLANRLFAEALQNHQLAAFPCDTIENEVPFGSSRLDFRLSASEETCWVEVKSVTYAENGIGLFPDAPTSRGRKHLGELAELVRQGHRASAVFIAQREDALSFAPFKEIDPDFTEILETVHRQGVEVHAYRCRVSLEEIRILEEVPIENNFLP